MKRFLLLANFVFVNVAIVGCANILAQASFPSVLEYVAPTYPPAALAVRAAGTVRLAVDVDSTGKVNEVKAISGHPLLKQMAEKTVEKWNFSAVPGLHFLTISMDFIPNGQDNKDVMTIRGPYTIELFGRVLRIDIS